MATCNIYKESVSYILEDDPTRSITPTGNVEISGTDGHHKKVLVHFDSTDVTSSMLYKQVQWARLQAVSLSRNGSQTTAKYAPLDSAPVAPVNWNTAPNVDESLSQSPSVTWTDTTGTINGVDFVSVEAARKAIYNGLAFSSDETSGLMFVPSANYFIYLSTTSSDVVPAPTNMYPATGGNAPKNAVNRFSWAVGNADCIGEIHQTSAQFKYRNGSEGEYTVVDCGTNEYYDMPAGTITSDTMQWYVVVYYSYGSGRQCAVQTVNTTDSLSTAVADSPKNTVIDGASENTFRWTHINESGTAQTKAELQKSADGSVWETFKTVIGSVNNAVVSGDTFANGDWYWRVRTYNSDNVAGSWSDAVSLSVIGKPVTPTVTATSKPKPTVSWTNATGQQGNQIKVVGVYDSGTRYGTESSVSLPVILEDGSYTINFRIQNSNGFWSDWASCSITVTNTGTESIPITATQSNSIVNIAWDDNDISYTRFVVYRDGVAIYAVDALSGTGNDYSYNDIYVSGSHSYAVKALKASGDYDYSDDATVNATVDVLTLIDVESEAVLKLSLQTTSYSDISFTDSAISALMHITGADYPMIEVSRFRDKVVTFESAFKVGDANRLNLEALFGKSVCIKTSKGSVIVGCLVNSSKSETEFYISYTCQVSQINYGGDVEI